MNDAERLSIVERGQKAAKAVVFFVASLAEEDVLTRAAALAFYSVLSFAPVLVLLLWGASFLGESAQLALLSELKKLLGQPAAGTIVQVLKNAQADPSLGSMSAIISAGALFFSATTGFAHLQQTLNDLWNISPKHETSVRQFIRARLVSITMLAALGLLLAASLAISATVAFLFSRLGPLVVLSSLLSSVLVFSIAFAAIYKAVPDCTVDTRDAILGGIVTGVLFAIGKELLGVYLGQGSIGSVYGAAGSLFVFLMWTYYSATVVLAGAKLTQLYATHFGSGLGSGSRAESGADADESNARRNRASSPQHEAL